MRDQLAILQVERRLVELACPAAQLRCKIRELSDHHEDLKHEALTQGLSETEAIARADQLLGEPVALAEHLAAALRQSSWWGRHPILGFCVLPPLMVLVLALLGMLLDAIVGVLYFNPNLLSSLAAEKPGMTIFRNEVLGTYYAVVMLAVWLFCRLARRTVSGPKWALAACAVCALHGWFFYLYIGSDAWGFGYSTHANWIPALLPLAMAALIWVRQRRLNTKYRAFNAEWQKTHPKPCGGSSLDNARRPSPNLSLHKGNFLTPTTVIASLILVAIVSSAVWGRIVYVKYMARTAELRTKIWPAERAVVVKQIAARQADKGTIGGTTIDLKSKVNAALNDSLGAKPEATGNTLAELPAGVHIFGGVPFDVEGRVQLWGRGLADSGKRFPRSIRDINVGRVCRRIHLLHGAAFITDVPPGTNVARLVLHYADGSQAEIGINAGEHVQDWCGPIYMTENDENLRETTAQGTELAWVGVNPWLKEKHPQWSLRLYKSSFENPHPDREIRTIDYVSTLTKAAPFLLGLNVE